MTTRRALWMVIGISTLLRFALAASMDGWNDEAYYFLYGKNLDWSFFDHPPMVAVVGALGGALAGWVGPVFGPRFGFIVMFAGSTWLMARLTERFFGPRAGVLAAVVLNSTLFYGLLVGTTAGPDGPLLFFWLLTLDRLSVAFGPDGRTSTWLGVGLAWGLAMLSKYHAVLLPVGAVLYLLIRPPARRCLFRPGPYLATAVGLAVFSPVLCWNAAHGWISFLFHLNRFESFKGFRLHYVLEAIVGQVICLFPWLWVCLLIVLVRSLCRGPRRWGDGEAFLISQFVPAVALFMGMTARHGIVNHWPLIGFVALMPLLGRTLSGQLDARPVLVRSWLVSLVAIPVTATALFLAHLHLGLFQDGQGRLAGLLPAKFDLTVDTFRWDQIARELKRRGLCDDPNTFLFTDSWRLSAQLAMATRLTAPVACFHPDARCYTFWTRGDDYVGRDGIFVRVAESQAWGEYYAPWFRKIEPIAEFPIVRAGCPIQRIVLYRCVNLTTPFPFGNYQAGIPRPARRTDFGQQGKVMIGLTPPKVSTGRQTR